MYDPKESSSLAFDELGLEVPFAELPPAAGKPAPAAEHFAFAESPFAEHEEPETEALAWHDLEADEQESAWRDEGGGEDEWLDEDEEKEEPDCPHCGSRAELEAEEFTEECEHGHESDESDSALGESWLEREWDPENEDEIDFEEEWKDLAPANLPDQSLAQTPFSPQVRARLEEPLPEAKLVRGAMQWNAASHPAISEIDAATLLAQLEIYVDRAGIVQAMQDKADLRELATDPGAVLAVMAQQFQCKILAPPPPPPPAPKKKKKAIDPPNPPDPRNGLLGEGTLDALGFVRHRGGSLNKVDEANVGSLNKVDEANVDFHVKKKSAAFRRLGETYKLDPAPFKALGEDVNPENWYYLFANPPFLGQPFQKGVHIELIRRLRMGERWLLSQPQYSLLSPAQLGAALSIDEPHKGGRVRPNDADSQSMHTFGLAVDIAYKKNPWVAGQHGSPGRNKQFKAVSKNVALLLAGKDEELNPTWLASLGNADGGTDAAFSAIRQRHNQMLEYLRLQTDRQGLLAAIEMRRQSGGAIDREVIKANETIESAAKRWADTISKDRDKLLSAFGRNPTQGFLNLHRDLVVALRDHGTLAWGAIDLGVSQSGDMMHFDCRPSGLGYALASPENPNQRTTGKNHPSWTPPPQQSKPATKKRKIPSKSKELETQDFEQGEWNETSWETDDEFDSADDSPKQPSLVELARIAKSRALKKSRGLCFRWVKLALKQSGLVDIYLPGVAAKNAGYELTKHGFINVITSDNYSINSPYDAPVGAVLVYDKTSDAQDKNAKYGHIEIRTVDGFASDYFSKNARTGDARSGLSGRGRRLIGVYIKIPNQDSEYFAYDENEGEWFEDEDQDAASSGFVQEPYLGGQLCTVRDSAICGLVTTFISPAALNQDQVEVLLYIHGLLGSGGLPKNDTHSLVKSPVFGLAKHVAASGRPIILVVPQMQIEGNKSWRTGGLDCPWQVNRLIAECLTQVGRRQRRVAPSVRSFVIAGHSKAYEVLNGLARRHAAPEMAEGALFNLSGLWALDSTYGPFPQKDYEALLASKPRLVVRIIYQNGSKSTDKFKGRTRSGRLALTPVKVGHGAVPGHALPGLLASLSSQTPANEDYAFESDLEDFAGEDEFGDEAFEGEYETDAELDEALEGFEGLEEDEDENEAEYDHENAFEAEQDFEDHELDPALTSLAERVMSREDPHFELDSPKRWTRCFAQATIDKLVQGYKDNQAAADANRIDRNSCIVMLNVGLGQLLDIILKESRARSVSDRRVRMANLPTKSIQAAMKTLQKGGYALPPKRFEFYDRRKHTAGTLKPETLKLSVLQYVLALSKAEGCWFAFGLSIMDGYHSVLLLVHRRPDGARVYWLDQFSAGLTVDVTSTLDDVLTEKTKTFWQGVMDSKNKGYNTTIQLWPLRRKSR